MGTFFRAWDALQRGPNSFLPAVIIREANDDDVAMPVELTSSGSLPWQKNVV